jgi:Tfp pilus assembly PilM family ATPase
MVSSVTFIRDILNFIKSDLTSNITDPLATSRTNESKFVMTSYPQRKAIYPIITIKLVNQKANRAGMQTTAMDVTITLEIRVWARNQIEKDDISNKIYKRLRDIQFTASTGSIANDLHHYKLNSDVEVDEDGEGNPKCRILQVEYKFYSI